MANDETIEEIIEDLQSLKVRVDAGSAFISATQELNIKIVTDMQCLIIDRLVLTKTIIILGTLVCSDEKVTPDILVELVTSEFDIFPPAVREKANATLSLLLPAWQSLRDESSKQATA